MVGLKSKTKRMIKTSDEISNIKKAIKLTEQVIHYSMNRFKVGMSEQNLSDIITSWCIDNKCELGFLLVQGEKNSATIHGEPSNNKIRRLLLLDIGLKYKGYFADISRTYLFNPTDKMKKVYKIVKTAYDKSISAVKVGVSCREVDKIATDIINNNGYHFRHSLGHGIGLEVHEFPKIGPKSNHKFRKNMVFTIEPGVYIKNQFGIRIEDDFVLSKKLQRLSKIEIPEYD